MTEYSICPWWAGYILASPMRKLAQNPARLLEPFVHTGMTVLEPGPGMGFFTLELARLVGPEGRVIAVDVQPHMIASLRRRAERARLIDRPLLRASGHGPDLADMRGAFSSRDRVGREHRSRPLSGSRPQASLNAGSYRSTSRSSASS
jgi:SAM-dependent methyltransferase